MVCLCVWGMLLGFVGVYGWFVGVWGMLLGFVWVYGRFVGVYGGSYWVLFVFIGGSWYGVEIVGVRRRFRYLLVLVEGGC